MQPLPTYQCREAIFTNAVKASVNGISACAPVDSDVAVTLDVCASEQTIWLAWINQIKVAFCYIFSQLTDILADILGINNSITALLADITTIEGEITAIDAALLLAPKYFTVSGIDLKVETDTDIFTVPAGYTFILQDYFLRADTVNTLTVGAEIGIVESGSGNGMSITTNTGIAIVADGEVIVGLRPPDANSIFTCAAGNKVQFHVKTGAAATAFTGTVFVVGILVPV